MIRLESIRCIAMLLAVMILFGSTPCVAQTQDVGEPNAHTGRFLAWCEEARPDHGAVVAMYSVARVDHGDILAQRVLYGWDAGTGAWLNAGPNASVGRTGAGRGYRSPGTDGSIQMIKPPDDMPLLAVAEAFPRAMLAHFVERPGVVVDAESLDDGGWRVMFAQWSNHEGPLGVVEFSGSGRAIRRWQDDPDDRREVEFRYAEDAGHGGIEIVASLPGRLGLALAEVVDEPGGASAWFEPERVAERARELALSVEVDRRAMQRGYSRTADGELVVDPDALGKSPYGGSSLRRWRWPVLGAGVVLVVVAGAEYRRRRAS